MVTLSSSLSNRLPTIRKRLKKAMVNKMPFKPTFILSLAASVNFSVAMKVSAGALVLDSTTNDVSPRSY